MHDEAAVHYIDMIDQTTLGHRMIKKQFNTTPRAGWQIDPFGHSAVQAYLLGAELGFDSVHFARIDYQDREKRKADKALEVIWRGSRTFGSSSQIFANVFPVNYSPPDGFGFEILDESIMPVQDDLMLSDYNVEERVNDFVAAAIAQANVTRTNDIMYHGGRFQSSVCRILVPEYGQTYLSCEQGWPSARIIFYSIHLHRCKICIKQILASKI
ncbi:hypothetical protein GQ55_9G358700 [Panicum hallii var. hallii]|uniref:Glycoside hydrolase family 38 N-terminal domain-containing protein n=1 Tax=Panicum hallii var. hallii TaxID=1504633 RepID=A0A2T7C8P9_9POAL|nr:hypothetical protein GQ55_9G358700 [Panicum hallii var. hallii]